MRSIVFFFLILSACVQAENGFQPAFEEKIDNKFTKYAARVTIWLQSFNDEHLGKTRMGRFLHYDEMKTKLTEINNQSESRGVKKMGMTMMPLVFHIGATSTWMLLTTILAAKSLAVGLMLLVFKIAVSSAKLASFFTHLKHSKQSSHDWTPQWSHFDHHSELARWADRRESKIDPRIPGPQARLDDFLPNTDPCFGCKSYIEHHIEHHPDHHGTISHHIPEWTPNDIPHHFHEYRNNESPDFKNHEFHNFKDNDHDFNFNTHINDYKTIPIHDLNGFGDGSHSDYNPYDGAKKKIDAKVG